MQKTAILEGADESRARYGRLNSDYEGVFEDILSTLEHESRSATTVTNEHLFILRWRDGSENSHTLRLFCHFVEHRELLVRIAGTGTAKLLYQGGGMLQCPFGIILDDEGNLMDVSSSYILWCGRRLQPKLALNHRWKARYGEAQAVSSVRRNSLKCLMQQMQQTSCWIFCNSIAARCGRFGPTISDFFTLMGLGYSMKITYIMSK